MNKIELKIHPKMVLNGIAKAMQKLADGEITPSEANKIAERAKELRKSNFTIDMTGNTRRRQLKGQKHR